MGIEYWYIRLPSGDKATKHEMPQDHINRELSELVSRGWHVVSHAEMSGGLLGNVSFVLRKECT